MAGGSFVGAAKLRFPTPSWKSVSICQCRMAGPDGTADQIAVGPPAEDASTAGFVNRPHVFHSLEAGLNAQNDFTGLAPCPNPRRPSSANWRGNGIFGPRA